MGPGRGGAVELVPAVLLHALSQRPRGAGPQLMSPSPQKSGTSWYKTVIGMASLQTDGRDPRLILHSLKADKR